MEIMQARNEVSEEIARLREELAQAYEAKEIATKRANSADKQIFILKEQVKALISAIRALTPETSEPSLK